MDAQSYLDLIRFRLATSTAIVEVNIVKERASENQGQFRARLRLHNGDFLEISEYFRIKEEEVQTVEYRFQWMDPAKETLRKRWDNAPHYPKLPGFPHHIHIGNSGEVIAGFPLNIPQFIELFEHEVE